MQEVAFVRPDNRIFMPATEEDAQRMSGYKLGAGMRMKTTQMTKHNLNRQKLVIACFVSEVRHEERVLRGIFAPKLVRGEWYEPERSDLEVVAAGSLLV